MCEFCNNAKLFECKALVEEKDFKRGINGIPQLVPIYIERRIPTNYCPSCGEKIK